MSDGPLFDVARGALVPSLTYASPAWSGFASAGDKSMLQAVLTKAKRWGLYGGKHPLELAKICETADMELLRNVIKDCDHVLYDLLPPKKMHGYNLRTRLHQHVLPIKKVFADKNFWTECCMLICIDYLCMFS